jgi:ketosteroid isomerase-like protein
VFMRTRLMMLVLLAVAACARTESPQEMAAREQSDLDSARAAINEGNQRFVRFVNANQADSLAALYTSEGRILPPDLPAAVGRDSIQARMASIAVPGARLTITNETVVVSGPLAIGRGVFSFVLPESGGRPGPTVTGKYMEHWHKIDGTWRLVESIWNNDAPAPAPPRR